MIMVWMLSATFPKPWVALECLAGLFFWIAIGRELQRWLNAAQDVMIQRYKGIWYHNA